MYSVQNPCLFLLAMQKEDTTEVGFVSRSLSYLHGILWRCWRDFHKGLGFAAGNVWRISSVNLVYLVVLMIICVVRNAEARNGEIRRRSSTSTKWQATHMEVPIHSQYPGPNSVNKIKRWRWLWIKFQSFRTLHFNLEEHVPFWWVDANLISPVAF